MTSHLGKAFSLYLKLTRIHIPEIILCQHSEACQDWDWRDTKGQTLYGSNLYEVLKPSRTLWGSWA